RAFVSRRRQARRQGEDHEAARFELRIITKNGETRYMDITTASVEFDGGPAVIGTAFDVTDTKKAQAQVRFQAQLLNNVRESVIATDLEGNVTYWGNGAEALYGHAAEEALGKHISLIIAPGYEVQEQAHMDNVLAEGSWSGEYVQHRKHGPPFWAQTSIALVRDERGNPMGMVGIDFDITERKRAEEALKILLEAEKNWSAELESANRRLTVQNAVGQALLESTTIAEGIHKCLEALGRTLGWELAAFWKMDETEDLMHCASVWTLPSADLDELKAETIKRIFPPGQGVPRRVWDTTDSVWLEDVRSESEFYRSELAFQHGIHGAMWFLVQGEHGKYGVIELLGRDAKPLDDEMFQLKNAIGRELGLFIERRRADERINKLNQDLQRRIDEFQTILDVAPVGLLMATDPWCRVIRGNATATRILRVTSDANISSSAPPEEQPPFRVFRHGVEIPAEELPVQLAAARGVAQSEVELDIVHADGSVSNLLVTAAPLFDSNFAPRGSIGAFLDVTQQRRAAEELQARARQQAVVAQLGQDALKSEDLDEFMREAVQIVAATLATECCGIFELSAQDASLLLREGCGWQKGLAGKAQVETGVETVYNLLSVQPVIFENLRADAWSGVSSLLREHGVASGISVLIAPEARPFGVLGAYTATRRQFSEDDANFLKAVSNIIASVIERARHYEALNEKIEQETRARAEAELANRRLSAQTAVGEALLEASTTQEGVQKFLQTMGEALGWKFAAFWSVAEAENVLLCDAVWRSDSAEAWLLDSTKQIAFPLGVGVPGRVWETGQPLWMEDVLYERDSSNGESEDVAPSERGVWIPVHGARRIVGVIGLLGNGNVGMDDSLVHAKYALANQLGQFIERKRAEAALAESEERYRTILDSMNEGVVSVDGKLRVRSANSCARELLKIDGASMIGQPLGQVIRLADESGRDIEDVSARVRECVADYEVYEDDDVFMKAFDGSLIPVALTVSPEHSEEKKTSKAVVLFRDVSHKREVDRLRDSIISLVSHELRTPILHIKGFASTLLQPDVQWSDEAKLDCIRVIDKEADRLSKLVNDLLEMSRLQSGAVPLQLEQVAPSEIARNALKQAAPFLQEHKVALQAPRSLPHVQVDASRIEQVMVNLIHNAAKYSPSGSRIDVRAERMGDEVVFSVTDRGVGIAPEFHEKIFERFTRLVSSDAPQTPGTGLGLALSKTIIEVHGGSIWVESETGKGSTFYCSLPISAPPATNAGRDRRSSR
ncbi:MAG: PAS domain S-box protein, partial [Chloroflexi bacterium]|nr:PAS domain S-box protein [Chloroflexota bacterium]